MTAERPRTNLGADLLGPLVLALGVVVVWGASVLAGTWYARREQSARLTGGVVTQFQRAATQLLSARARGELAEPKRMSRAEASSWAYWETVARESGLSADSFAIEPSYTEPEPGTGGPVVLSTLVTMESVTLKQLLTFLAQVTEERPYVGISSVEATKATAYLWDASIETFLYFEEVEEDSQSP